MCQRHSTQQTPLTLKLDAVNPLQWLLVESGVQCWFNERIDIQTSANPPNIPTGIS